MANNLRNVGNLNIEYNDLKWGIRGETYDIHRGSEEFPHEMGKH
jgi:hypothetical protein